MLGPQQNFAQRLRDTFFKCIKKGQTEGLDLLIQRMQDEGISLSFIEQVRVLHEAVVFPSVVAHMMVQIPLLSPEIQRAGLALILNSQSEIIPLFGSELSKARAECRFDDARLIERFLARFIDPKELNAQTFTPAASMAQRQEEATHQQQNQGGYLKLKSALQ
ncbi:MAG: hypothetical protein JSR17_05115 [Proteobacteria bacterium]|nr:hypothetical protein [Pseudomonadota bacterium]